MKIQLEITGGFAYLPAPRKPLIVDTAEMDAKVAVELELLVQECRFFEQPAQSTRIKKGAADYMTYTITVDDGSHVHTIQLTDPLTDIGLHRLITHLRNLARPAKP